MKKLSKDEILNDMSVVTLIMDKYKDNPNVNQDALHYVLFDDDEFDYIYTEFMEEFRERYKNYVLHGEPKEE